jgi:hypothetical protein
LTKVQVLYDKMYVDIMTCCAFNKKSALIYYPELQLIRMVLVFYDLKITWIFARNS